MSSRLRIPDAALFWFVMVAGFGTIIAASILIGMDIGHG